MFALLFLAVGVGGFSAGRFSVPEQETRVEYRSLAVEDITAGFKWGVDKKKTIKRNITSTPTDAGVIVVDLSTEVETTIAAGSGHEDTKRNETIDSVQSFKLVNRPTWRLTADVGAAAIPPWITLTGPLVVGAAVEYRLIGGVWVGVWVNTVGAGGVRVAGELP